MAHQVYPGGRRRVRIPEVARDLVTGEWQRSHGRAGGLSMSASTVERYRDLLVRLDVIRRVPWGTRGTHRSGARFGDRFTYGREFGSLFGRGRFSRAGMLVWLVTAALRRHFGNESVPMTSFVLRTSLVSRSRPVEKVPAAPADVGFRPPAPPDAERPAGPGATAGEASQPGGIPGRLAGRIRTLHRGELVYLEAFTCAWCGRVSVSKRGQGAKYCPRPRGCRTLAWRARRRGKCTDG